MGNQTIEGKVRKFFKFVGIGQLIHKESVGSTGALKILGGIDTSSLLGRTSARRYSCLGEMTYDFGKVIDNPSNYLVGINDREFSGTYKQLLSNGGALTHKLDLENNLLFNLPEEILFLGYLGYLKKEELSEEISKHMKKLPASYHIRWQTKV